MLLIHHILIISLTAILLLGCDETVSPLIGEERPFTVYGYLDPTASTQVLRVIPIADNINAVDVIEINAEVRTIHQETSEVTVWRKTPALFSDSTSGVVFRADFTPVFEHTYRLEIESSEGELLRAETVVPRSAVIRTLQGGNPLRPGFLIEGELPNLVQSSVNYEAVAMQPSISDLSDVVVPIRVSYKGTEVQGAGGWDIRANLFDDFSVIQSTLSRVCLTTSFITLRSAEFEVFVGDARWIPPGGEFDASLLVQPGTFSNVENGFGYFGSGYSNRFSIRLSPAILEQIGYALDRPCNADFGFDPEDPDCQEVIPCFDSS